MKTHDVHMQENQLRTETHAVREATFDEATREAEIVVIEEGESKNHRVYTNNAIATLLPLLQENRKVFLDHLTLTGARYERSLKDWVATVKEARVDKGKLYARVVVHDEWLWQRMREAPDEIGVSIDAVGTITHTNAGEAHVTKIVKLNSVDFVTHAAAGGRVDRLLASEENVIDDEAMFRHLKEAYRDGDEDAFREGVRDLIREVSKRVTRFYESTQKEPTFDDAKNTVVTETLAAFSIPHEQRATVTRYLLASIADAPESAYASEARREMRNLLTLRESHGDVQSPSARETLSRLDETVMRLNFLDPEKDEDVTRYNALMGTSTNR